jgi:nucleoside-diphosphate-sugar epimerase
MLCGFPGRLPATYEPMKVFLTGVAGYLGRSMACHLLAEGYQVGGSSRRATSIPCVDVAVAALGDPIEPAMFEGCDVVIHAAHDFEAGRANKNIEGTLAMRDAAIKAGVPRQIFLTSYSAQPAAESEYGRTKYAIERFFSDSSSVNLRMGLVIGSGGLFARQRSILLRMPIVPLLGAGDFPVAVVAISHVLAATEVIVRTPVSGFQNLFYDARPTMKEFVQEIIRHAGRRPRLFPVGARFGMAAVKVARAAGLRIPVDPGQIRSLQLNEGSHWQSDLPDLLEQRDGEFQLSYALDQLKTGFRREAHPGQCDPRT